MISLENHLNCEKMQSPAFKKSGGKPGKNGDEIPQSINQGGEGNC